MSKAFIDKHKPLTPEEVKTKIKQNEEMKKGLTHDAQALEAELELFNNTQDPLLNPSSGKPMCWIRRPSQKEWEELVPKELAVYSDVDDIPKDKVQKYNDMVYELMSKIIVEPKHDAIWWKQHSNVTFLQLFNMHLTGVFKELGVLAANF